MVFRTKRDYQPVRRPLRPAHSVTRMMQDSGGIAVPEMMTKHTTKPGYFVHILLNWFHFLGLYIVARHGVQFL
jgi:hypothetical protein